MRACKQIKWVVIIYLMVWAPSSLPAIPQGPQNQDVLQTQLEGASDSTLRKWSTIANLAWRKLVRSNLDSALIFAQRSAEIATVLRDDSLLISAYRQIAATYSQSGDQAQARIYCERMLLLLDQNNYLGSFRYHNMLGIVAFEEGNYEQALAHQMNALDATQAGELIGHLSTVYSEISRVFDRMKQPQKALEYALKDRAHTYEYQGARSQIIATYNLAIRYMNLDSFELADHLFAEADSLSVVAKLPFFRTAVTLSRGTLFVKSDQPSKALTYLEKARSEMEAIGNVRGYLTARLNIGEALFKLSRFDESVQVYRDAIKELEASGHDGLLQSGRKKYAAALQKSGNNRLAYEVMDKYWAIHDSLQGAEASQKINELEIKYQTAEKESQLWSQEITITNRTRQRNNYLALAGLLALSLIVLFIFQKQRIKKNKALAKQEKQIQSQQIDKLQNEKRILAMASMIEGQENERVRIAKDLHDGLGVLLSSVRRQVQNVQSEIIKLTEIDIISDTERLISVACEEVRRISHDMMPSALRELGLGEAIRDLAFQVETDHQIKTHLDLPETLNLTEIEAVNIYRIVQEFTNNTIKYAGAKNLHISITQGLKVLKIRLADDGSGFNLEAAREKNSLGISNMESRVNFLNGQFYMDASNGTSCDIFVPVTLE